MIHKHFVCLIALLICLLALPSFAQEDSQQNKTIRWGSAELPQGCCHSYYKDDRLITSYSDENVYFQIGLDTTTEKKFLAVMIALGNKTETPLTILPENFRIIAATPKEKIYHPLSVEEVSEKIENRGRWQMFAKTFLAGMATRQRSGTITDNRGNRAEITVTGRDNEARRNAQIARNNQQIENAERSAVIKAVALPKHTLFKDEVIGGFVFFKKESVPPAMVISFKINNVTYEIPFGK